MELSFGDVVYVYDSELNFLYLKNIIDENGDGEELDVDNEEIDNFLSSFLVYSKGGD